MAKAAVTNATLAFERAQTLLKTSAGTQKTVEDAEADAAHRAGAARPRRRPGWRAARSQAR